MILLRDFALYVLPVFVAAGGWLFTLSLRKQTRRSRARDGQVPAARSGAVL